MFLLLFVTLLARAEAPESLETVRVVAKRKPTVGGVSVQSYEVKPGRHTTLAEVVRQDPAVSTPAATETAWIQLRGQDPIQTRYFLEGIPLTDAQYQGGNLSFIPLESLGAVQIFADALPVTLGEDGLGGGVDFSLREPGETQVGAAGGSFSSAKAFGHISQWKGSIHASYEQSKEDFFFFDDGGTPFNLADDSYQRRQNNAKSRFRLLPQWKGELGRGHTLKAFALNAITASEIPGPVSGPTNGSLDEFFLLAATRHQWKAEPISGSEAIYVRHHQGALQGLPRGGVGDRNGESRELTVGFKSNVEWWNDADVTLESSLSAERSEFKSEGMIGNLKHQRYTLPIGNTLSWKIGSVTLSPSVLAVPTRYESETNGNRNYFALSPRFTGTYDLKAFRVRGSVGRYHRFPSLLELYGGVQGIVPNPQLAMESAVKATAGIDWAKDEWVLSYTYSIARPQDLVVYERNSQNSQIASNIGSSQIQSHEWMVRFKSGGLTVNSSLVFLASENRTAIASQLGKELPFRAPVRFQNSILFQTGMLEFNYGNTYYSDMYADRSNSKKLSSFWIHQAGVSAAAKSFGKFRLDVQNLTDVTTLAGSETGYLTTESFGVSGFPAPGRRVTFTWIVDV